MTSQRISKNDTYALLIAEGVSRNFIVVPEFRVRIPTKNQSQLEAEKAMGRYKCLDLVWLERVPQAPLLQECPWPIHWKIAAAFEIDGCNVSITNEFERHISDLPKIYTRGAFNFERFIFLYTSAFDRSQLDRKNWDSDIKQRADVAAHREPSIGVLSAGSANWKDYLPN